VDPIDQLALRYRRYNPVVVSGATESRMRSNAVRRFQGEPEVKLFIANPSAAGAGVTLTAASDAIFFSFSNRAADFLQAVDRIHRRGQSAPNVTVHVILCSNTVEHALLNRLIEKERAQGELLRDRENGIRVEDAIADLTSHE
jgi:SNF2 family DNA or RNA helicase